MDLPSSVLEQLGEKLTINVTNAIYTKEDEDVLKMMKNKSQKDLINLPMIVDEQKMVRSV